MEQSPLRPNVAKPDRAPVWIPRSDTGYFVVTCTDCLRSDFHLQPGSSARAKSKGFPSSISVISSSVLIHDKLPRMSTTKQAVKLSTHIDFNGQCEAAFKFYAQSLGGNIGTMLTWSQSPLSRTVPPEWREKICHASLQIQGNELAGTDVPADKFQAPQGFQLLLDINDLHECKRAFEALAEKGTVRLPLQKTFWAGLYGIVVDQFGLSWEINCSG